VRELQPPPRSDGSLGSFSFGTSSADFHSYVRIVDDMPHVLEAYYSGYAGTSGQSQYLGLEVATEALLPLLEPIALAAGSPSGEERAFFTNEMVRAQPRLHREFAWWVRERYVRLAGRVGTTAAVPALLDDLRAELTRAQEQGPGHDREESRMMDLVLALAKITGWDARLDERGQPRPVIAVAKEYLSECTRGIGQPGPAS
jgi:hypothetical protein